MYTDYACPCLFVQASTVRTVAIIPNGFIRTMYPLRGYSSANDTNWGAVGKNWLDDPPNADFIKLLLSSRKHSSLLAMLAVTL